MGSVGFVGFVGFVGSVGFVSGVGSVKYRDSAPTHRTEMKLFVYDPNTSKNR